jgi:hypothetical protein
MEPSVVAVASTNDPTRRRRSAIVRKAEGLMMAAELAFAADAGWAKLKESSQYQHSRARPIQQLSDRPISIVCPF